MSEATIVVYGARSTIARWFDQYWSERDRQALPWLCVILTGLLLAFGPQFMLWIVSLLPADELGNSGASIFAHQIILAIATVLALGAGALILRRLARPSCLVLDAEGVALAWNFLFFTVSGHRRRWSDLTSIYIFQPAEKIDFRACHLNFATAQNIKALSVPLEYLEGDERRQQVAEAISKYALHAVEPRVFSELAPQKDLSFTSLWLEALSAAPSRESLLPLPPGTILDGRYCVENRLGAGGQGTVYLAEDNKLSTKVVLKESLLPVYTDIINRRKALESFHREAFALEALKHDKIVGYLGSFVADHRAYLVLQFVPGRTLAAVVKEEGPIEPERAISLAIQMCEILSALHELTPAMVHRDYTPDNLILNSDDKLTLIDFAVSTPAWTTASDDSEVAGKAAYMAPEQFKGAAQVQSDVYSMGATMFYLLTGETPEPLTESHPILNKDTTSKDLNDIVAGATRLDLKARFQTAAAVKDALQALS
jgi:tRNA A-37 threonylcarbamoyl transferase component Bud32